MNRLHELEVFVEKEIDVSVGSIERCRVLRDIDIGVVDSVDQSSMPGTFQRVSPVPLPAIR
jgi:hypothetical protein